MRNLLTGLALADHIGDVNNYLPWLADALGEERPEWNDHYDRYVFPWEHKDLDENWT